MKHISGLRRILRTQWGMDKRKLDCVVHTMLAIICFRTVNLSVLAKGLPKSSQLTSRYRRLQRLLAGWPKNAHIICPWLLSWFFKDSEPLSLTMDRTNWQWGKANINFLVVAVVYKRMALPLLWVLLPKKGNSNASERIALMKKLLKQIDRSRIKNLLCDREFVGKEWFEWLQKEEIPFKIRVKDNYLTLNAGGKETQIEALFYDLPRGQKRVIRGKRPITANRIKVHLVGSRLESGELMVVASHNEVGDAIECYCERWEIETLFQNLKSRGFDLESTHVVCPERLNALMSLVAIAAFWCIKVGEWRVEQGKVIKLKNHGRPSKSLFRHGLDLLADVFCGEICQKQARRLIKLWRLLTPPRVMVLL